MVSTKGLFLGLFAKYRTILLAFTISRATRALLSSKLLKSLLIPMFFSIKPAVICFDPVGKTRHQLFKLIAYFTQVISEKINQQ